MSKNALDDFGADALLLVSFIDDHIPDGGAIYEICQYPPEPYKLIAIPCTERYIGMAQHVFRIVERPVLCPGRLMEQPKKLGRFEFFLFGKGNCRLEGRRHLVLNYLPITGSHSNRVYEENDVNASPKLP